MSIPERLQTVLSRVEEKFGDAVQFKTSVRQLILEVVPPKLKELCLFLRDDPKCRFEQLIDLCGVDYQGYRNESSGPKYDGRRFAVTSQLLSISNNCRVRVRAFPEDDEMPRVSSVMDIWNSANWYEREAFDLYGILFDGHPDLRRILTDYGFVGHPFRKDFPISGNVEMRYDPEKRRVVYEPVSIEPRSLSKRVIREEAGRDRDS